VRPGFLLVRQRREEPAREAIGPPPRSGVREASRTRQTPVPEQQALDAERSARQISRSQLKLADDRCPCPSNLHVTERVSAGNHNLVDKFIQVCYGAHRSAPLCRGVAPPGRGKPPGPFSYTEVRLGHRCGRAMEEWSALAKRATVCKSCGGRCLGAVAGGATD
jgi:hypothetical protein